MSAQRPADVVAAALSVLGVAAGIVSIFYRPFLFAPPGLLLACIAIVMSAKNRRLAGLACAVISVGWLIGASIAVWDSNPLY
jgi:hypothetical protein